MELKLKQYITSLLIISFAFFYIFASWLKTNEAYRDFILTILVVHFVMSKLITIKGKQEK